MICQGNMPADKLPELLSEAFHEISVHTLRTDLDEARGHRPSTKSTQLLAEELEKRFNDEATLLAIWRSEECSYESTQEARASLKKLINRLKKFCQNGEDADALSVKVHRLWEKYLDHQRTLFQTRSLS